MTDAEQKFDPVSYEQTQRDQSNEESAAWHQWDSAPELVWWGPERYSTSLRSGWVAGFSILPLERAPALSAAEGVGSKGYVLTTDLSATCRVYHRNCR